MFESILNDKEIIERYEEVEKYELENGGWAYHNLNHVLNVCSTVTKVLESLDYSESFIECAKVAAILHDTGANLGKENHALRGYLFAKDYLARKNIDLEYKNLVLEAIKIHSDGFDTDNIIALAIIFADKLDVKNNRITEVGKTIVGNRQYQYVEDILIDIKDGNLIINFITTNEFNKLEVEEFYFMPKIFKAIKAFSSKVSLVSVVLLNGEEWDYFFKI